MEGLHIFQGKDSQNILKNPDQGKPSLKNIEQIKPKAPMRKKIRTLNQKLEKVEIFMNFNNHQLFSLISIMYVKRPYIYISIMMPSSSTKFPILIYHKGQQEVDKFWSKILKVIFTTQYH